MSWIRSLWILSIRLSRITYRVHWHRRILLWKRLEFRCYFQFGKCLPWKYINISGMYLVYVFVSVPLFGRCKRDIKTIEFSINQWLLLHSTISLNLFEKYIIATDIIRYESNVVKYINRFLSRNEKINLYLKSIFRAASLLLLTSWLRLIYQICTNVH